MIYNDILFPVIVFFRATFHGDKDFIEKRKDHRHICVGPRRRHDPDVVELDVHEGSPGDVDDGGAHR